MTLDDLRVQIQGIRARVLGQAAPLLPRLRLIELMNENLAIGVMEGPRGEEAPVKGSPNPRTPQADFQDVQGLVMLRVRNLLQRGPAGRIVDVLIRRIEGGEPKESKVVRRFTG